MYKRQDVASGKKRFELRKNDRGYKEGDSLKMLEFKDGKHTGRTIDADIIYMLEEYTGCLLYTSADSFLAVGQQQPTVLGRVNGEFRIVSGHRRNLANIMNIERGHEEYNKVRYLYKDMSAAMFELSLLIGNAYNRELTAWEKPSRRKS